MNLRAMSELTEGLLRVYDVMDQAAYEFAIMGREGEHLCVSRIVVGYQNTPNTPDEVIKILITLQKNMYNRWYDHGQGD